ncbi:GNAT family N-acetyltransferase [Streptomyces avermitilis]|uniref:GNAT family N-acetyltransferase n=1 Tax=Streptomyces avermitilis TaxID=33903 RepID=UPI003681E58B
MMPTWRLRDFHDDDLDRAVQIWDQDGQTDDSPPVFPISEVMAVARTGGPAVVAVVGEDLVGMAVAQVQGDRAWITLVALAGTWRNRGIGSALIAELERRLRIQGVRRIVQGGHRTLRAHVTPGTPRRICGSGVGVRAGGIR